jgi:hypothetical protein
MEIFVEISNSLEVFLKLDSGPTRENPKDFEN